MIPDVLEKDAQPYLDRIGREAILVWGAGLHGSWLMSRIPANGIGFIDTSPLKQHTTIAGKPVYAPDEVDKLQFDQIWIAVLSDAESIAHQLERRGMREGREFEVVFKNGKLVHFMGKLDRYLAFLADFDLTDRVILEVGYGGQLFSALLLLSLGARRMVLTDVVAYPRNVIERYQAQYHRFLEALAAKLPGRAVRTEDYGEWVQQVEIIREPHSASVLPFADGSFDGVYNTAVMEHVSDPARAIREFARVLRPQGLALCLAIGIHDHRANNPASMYNPWSFLAYSDEEWEAHAKNAYHQNRWRAADFRDGFINEGFEITKYETTTDHSLTAAQVERFSARFQAYSLSDLQALDLYLAATKRFASPARPRSAVG